MIDDRYILKAKMKNRSDKWIDGAYIEHHDTTHCMKEPTENEIHHLIIVEIMTDWELPNKMIPYEIDVNTLCQCTGMKDKNKRRLFEHDIVLFRGKKGIIRFDQTNMRYDITFGGNGRDIPLSSYYETEIEIVGNEYD